MRRCYACFVITLFRGKRGGACRVKFDWTSNTEMSYNSYGFNSIGSKNIVQTFKQCPMEGEGRVVFSL